MKTIIVPLVGDPIENLYQLGLREREAFLAIESRVTKLLSTNIFLRMGQDILSKARIILRKKEESFFDKCVAAYAEGLNVDPKRYQSFLSLFELAAHYGQVYPELKGILPGCTTVFSKNGEDITHTRLLDFPLVGIFDQNPRLYYWQPTDRPPILSYSCAGLAPFFFQGIHGSGISFALHYKPGKSFHHEGESIFEIAFETFFNIQNFGDFKKEIKKKQSVTKWSFLVLDKSGHVVAMDIEGPAQNIQTYNLNDSSPLIFTNIPLQQDRSEYSAYLNFSQDRQTWIKEKLKTPKPQHILDIMTNVEDQRMKNWLHPAATLATVGAYHVNLTKGLIDLKDGDAALTASDSIVRVNLADKQDISLLKKASPLSPFETAWKRASKAQSAFDQGQYDVAYHELQMAQTIMPHPVWKAIMAFYLSVWDFKFINNPKELSLIYNRVKELDVPKSLNDQWTFLIMRLEKKLDLSPTVTAQDVSASLQELFQQEKLATKPVFATWMKLLYPRMEILDVFSPHHK